MWDAVKLYMSKIWTLIKPTVMAFLSKVGQDLLSMAAEIVTDLANTDMSSSEKRSAAFDSIKERLVAEGKEVGDSLINLAIEIAVQKLKDK